MDDVIKCEEENGVLIDSEDEKEDENEDSLESQDSVSYVLRTFSK